MDQIVKELHMEDENTNESAYKQVTDKTSDAIMEEHSELPIFLELPQIGKKDDPKSLPTFYGIPKMHKVIPKLRFIAASCQSPLKPLDITVTRCLDVIYKFMCRYCKGIYNYTGTNRMWILDNSLQLKTKLMELNDTMTAHCISTWDFSTLYTTIPHVLLKEKMSSLVDFAFGKEKKTYIAANKDRAFWTNKLVKRYKCVTAQVLKDYINYLIDNIYVTLGNTIHKQIIGIPMGISCAPLLANLFLMTFEYEYMEKLEKKNIHSARNLNNTFRYIDDLINLNNDDFKSHLDEIYPKELEVKKENSVDDSSSYLDLYITILNNGFHTSLYDKRDSFNFNIVNYPYVNSSNIPTSPAYGVYSSRLLAIARACDSIQDFKIRHESLCFKLFQQGFTYRKLCQQMKKTLKKHDNLFAKYEEKVEVPFPMLANSNRHVTLRS